MKKLLILTAVVFAFSAPYAMAKGQGGGSGQGQGKGQKMFEQRDLDGDGYISKSEALTKAKERFNEMDLDGDGKISKGEAQEHRQKMKKKAKQFKNKRQNNSN